MFLGLAPIKVTLTELPYEQSKRYMIHTSLPSGSTSQYNSVVDQLSNYQLLELNTLDLPVCTAHQHQLLHHQNSSQKERGQTLLGGGMSAVCPTDWEGWVPWGLVFPVIDRCINLRLKAKILEERSLKQTMHYYIVPLLRHQPLC